MPAPRVTGYTAYIQYGDRPQMGILLYEENHQVGAISTADPSLFTATLDLLRHEGPGLSWEEGRKRLSCALGPVGEVET